MFLGIEIGATKLQLGVGRGDGPPLVALERIDAKREEGAAGIRSQIEEAARRLIVQHGVRAVGIGFGGPVDAAAGRTVISHQVEGWENFPLAAWCREKLGLTTVLGNDSDSAGLAEALFGAGRKDRIVFYTNVGSGIGGALVINGQLHSGSRGIAAELGHARPGPEAESPEQTVESVSSGFGMAAVARAYLSGQSTVVPGMAAAAAELRQRAGGQIEKVTGRLVVEAAGEGNALAQEIFGRAIRTFGWAIAQMITLVAPEVVVVGGGVPLAGETLFFAPLRREVERYVFPPLGGSYRLAPAELGEEVVVHGALAIAARSLGA
jgi:glucokinase